MSYKHYSDLLDDDYVVDTSSDWAELESELDEFEEDYYITQSLARGGRDVYVNPNNFVRLSGYTGYNLWNQKYRHKKRAIVSEAAYNRAIYNKRYNLLHHTKLSIDPVRVEYFINPTKGISPDLDGVLNDFERDGKVKPYVEYIGNKVYYVNEEKYSTYVQNRKIERENLKLYKQRDRQLKRDEKEKTKRNRREGLGGVVAKTLFIFMMIFSLCDFVAASQLNGANGEVTGTDDHIYAIMSYNNRDFCIVYYENKYYYCSIKYENNLPYFIFNGVKEMNLVRIVDEYVLVAGTISKKLKSCSEIFDHNADYTCNLMSDLRVVEHPGCNTYEQSRYIVFGAVYDIVHAKYVSQAYSVSKPRHIQTSLLSLCVNFPHSMLKEMVTSIMHEAALIYVEGFMNADPQFASPPTYEHTCFTTMHVMSVFPEVLFGGKSPDPTYELRHRAFKITGHGFSWKTIGSGLIKYPMFHTDNGTLVNPKFKLSIFCRLIGLVPFVLPDHTPFNITAALKRILGCRSNNDCERDYRINQNKFYYRTICSVRNMFNIDGKNRVVDINKYFYDETQIDNVPDITDGHLCRIGGRDLNTTELYEAMTNKYTFFSENYFNTMKVRNHSYLSKLAELGEWIYAELYLANCYFDDLVEMLTGISLMPHTKKALRMSYLVKYHTKAVNFPRVYPKSGYKFELAKYGKCGRLFVSYGDLILYTAGIAEFVKKLCSGVLGLNQLRTDYGFLESPSIYGSRVNVVSDTSIYEVTKAFDDMMYSLSTNTVGSSYALVFSDDTCVGTVTDHGLEFANVDISSNDTGVDIGQFSLYHKIANLFNETLSQYALSALFSEIRVENPHNCDENMLLTPESIFMGSGCAQTTGVNNIGNSLGNLVSMEMIESQYNDTQTFDLRSCYVEGFKQIGHEVTYDSCQCIEDIQFLKRSPLLCSNGKYIMCLNLGAILRSFGTVENDLTAIKCGLPHVVFKYLSRDQQISHFLAGVLKSYSPEPRNEVLDILCDIFRTPVQTMIFSYFTRPISKLISYITTVYSKEDYSHLTVDRSAILNRYKISDTDWDDFLIQLRGFGPGKVLHHNVLSAIYHVDYGVPMEH